MTLKKSSVGSENLSETDDRSKVGVKQNKSFRSLDYGSIALVVLVISVGAAAVVYSVPILAFNLFNIPAWIFGPLGVYTIIYSFVAGKDPTYYLVWGTVMFAVAIASALYNILNPFLVLGVLIIVIAVMGLIAYLRGKK